MDWTSYNRTFEPLSDSSVETMIFPRLTTALVVSIIRSRQQHLFVSPFASYSAKSPSYSFKTFSYKDHQGAVSGKSKSNIGKRASIRKNDHSTPTKHNGKNGTFQSMATTHVRTQTSPSSHKTAVSPAVPLPEPSVIFTNNHLLIVNKPAGYHSQPNEEAPSASTSPKCLLTKLKLSQLGGGSQENFLLPMHRLDQPCTGISLLAKTSKAGTRIGKAFRDKVIEKEYLCVVMGSLETMIQHSHILAEEDPVEPRQSRAKTHGKKNKATFYRLSGTMGSTIMSKNPKEGGASPSVSFKPLVQKQSPGTNLVPKSPIQPPSTTPGRLCHLDWTYLSTISSGLMMKTNGKNKDPMHLILVRTNTGAKHQIRAMMAQLAKSPICGDLRYGASEPLPDQSVALHARSLFIPSDMVSLGDTDFSRKFVADIPCVWKEYFSLTDSQVKLMY